MAYDANDPKDIEIVEGLIAEATKGLTTKRDELLSEVKGLRKQIREGGNDPKALEKLEADVDRLSTELETANSSLKAVTKERDKTVKTLDSETKFSRDLLVSNGLTEAFASAKVATQFMPAVKAMFTGKVEIKTEGDKRTLFIGDKPLGEAVTAWSQSDEGKHYVAAGNNSGGNANGGTGGAQTGKSIARAAFDAMPQSQRVAHFADGGTITDG